MGWPSLNASRKLTRPDRDMTHIYRHMLHATHVARLDKLAPHTHVTRLDKHKTTRSTRHMHHRTIHACILVCTTQHLVCTTYYNITTNTIFCVCASESERVCACARERAD